MLGWVRTSSHSESVFLLCPVHVSFLFEIPRHPQLRRPPPALPHSQAQHSHHVIQQVLGHLDTHNKDMPRVRAGIVQVLLETVAIAAKGSVGEWPLGPA